VRESMRKVLAEIQDGTFAREWIAEMDSGEKKLEELRRAAADQLLENVGRELRALMQTEAPEAHGVR
jgi:ketol-acid reductoisomerase